MTNKETETTSGSAGESEKAKKYNMKGAGRKTVMNHGFAEFSFLVGDLKGHTMNGVSAPLLSY